MSKFQQALFQLLRERIPQGISMVEEIAELLSVSTDSAYRRIRGETSLSLDEVQKLCQRYGISIDSLFGSASNSVTFSYRSIRPEEFDFKSYLTKILEDLRRINSFENKKITYLAKDVPLFYHFHYKELASFKIFFWLKTFMLFPEYSDRKFDGGEIDDDTLKLGNEVLETYVRIPSVEIWNDETINSALKQIEFYFESGLYQDPAMAFLLCDQLLDEINHVKAQAEKGGKILQGKEVAGTENNYQLYYNELTLVDNTVFLELNESKAVYLTHNLLNNLITTNENFCSETSNIIRNMMNKANLISSSSEKERNKFFLRMQEKIEGLKKRLESHSH